MDNSELWTLLTDVECMTALGHVRDNPAMAALIRLLWACRGEHQDPEMLRNAYIGVYDAWLHAAAKGRGGFAREALEAVLFEESAAASLCARMDAADLPYSLVSSMAHDLETLGQITAIEPAMCLLLCQRAGMTGETAARLPVWEPVLGIEPFDPRIDRDMLSRAGARRVAAFFRKQGTGIFARYPGSIYVGVSKEYPLGLRGVSKPDSIRLEEMVLYENVRSLLVENTEHLMHGESAGHVLLCGNKGTGKSATVKALLPKFMLEGLRIVEMPPAQLTHLPELFHVLRDQPCKFIVFVDDLTFETSGPEYEALKSALEGGLETCPENVVIYATCSRAGIVSKAGEGEASPALCALADRFDQHCGGGSADQISHRFCHSPPWTCGISARISGFHLCAEHRSRFFLL